MLYKTFENITMFHQLQLRQNQIVKHTLNTLSYKNMHVVLIRMLPSSRIPTNQGASCESVLFSEKWQICFVIFVRASIY